jgi:hypothetical protein
MGTLSRARQHGYDHATRAEAVDLDLALTTKLLVAAGAIFGGWLIVGSCMWAMRSLTALPRDLRYSFMLLDLWLGATERSVAIALTLWAPAQLPLFIGAWVAAKLAANWQKIKENTPTVRNGHMLALVGNAISFGIAIGAAVVIKPASAFLE